jgi:hypothetical protein
VLNVGEVPADLRIDVAVGPGNQPDTAVDTGDPRGTIAPGERRVLRVPVQFESLAIGHHVVAGEVATPGTTAPFEAGLGIQPWGFFAAVVVVVVAGLGAALFWRLWRRRRASASEPTETPDATSLVATG